MGYSQQTLQSELERVKQRKMQNPNEVRPWTDFTPQELTYKPPTDTGMYEQLQDQVSRNDDQVTAIALIKAQNRQNKALYEQALAQYNQAQEAFVDKDAPLKMPTVNPVSGAPVAIPTGPNGSYAGNWGKDGIPQVWDIKKINPNAPIVQMNLHGIKYSVNSQVAPIFQAFLQDLWKMGYHPKSIGGHNVRNIAGTNTPSLHSYGLAIDIDPGINPIYYNSQGGGYALPPNVGALAAKYGLKWGGNWKNTKDYMHFSVAYGGSE